MFFKQRWPTAEQLLHGEKGRTTTETHPESSFLACGDHPNSQNKKRSENAGAHENLSCGFPPISGIAPGVALRVVVFALLKS